ncbi:RNaseH domain-containing protein [Pleurocapsa sp. FMAR1]|uniref:RNaseH domain-containing protein n=1 Tax=Pleurocapsa sp. FMAR1 TaxID=3040204 RepID=UPI0029C87214|nr:RNaseH domain-containing protein [Pleurocapsa sp. FMAR1]
MTKQNLQANQINENQSNQKFYVKLGTESKNKDKKRVTLAFTIPDDLQPVIIEGFALTWTKEALANLAQIHSDVSKIKNLPYASLRGFLEFRLSNVSRIEPSMGLSGYTVSQQKQQSFAFINGGSKNQITKDLKPVLNDWLENHLVPYGQKEDVSEDAIERLRELQAKNKLLVIKTFKSQIFPWDWDKNSGTTQRKDIFSFPQFADHVARTVLENKKTEMFSDLGQVKRTITSNGGMSSGKVELLTKPICIENKGLFSLKIEFELVTFPSLHQPLLTMDVKKRRWLNSLKENVYSTGGINGYIFSKNHSDRVFNFKLNRRKNNETNKWEWQADSSFSVLQRELNLPLNVSNASQIVRGEADTDDCQVLLTYRNGIQDEKKHGIDAGVPPKDKLEAFGNIAKILEPQGIRPFDGYSKVEISHPEDKNAARSLINTPTAFHEIIENLQAENEDIPDEDKKSLDEMSDRDIIECLKDTFDFELSEKGIKDLRFKETSKNRKNQIEDLETLFKANKEAIKRLYPNETSLLIIFYENERRRTADFLQVVINMLWGETIEIKLQRLPENTHGAKETLPGSELNNQQRAELRVATWTPIAEQIAKIKRPKFCLVMAREYYPRSEDDKNAPHDDTVNKPSTCKALASIGRICVQFIRPPEIAKSGNTKIQDFIIRAQAATKDLIWAHSGRIDDVQGKVTRYFSDIELENRPQEIIAITIVRRNAGRTRGRWESTFIAVAIKISVETGLTQMCCCYKDSQTKQPVITDWKPFIETLFDISKISPISLGENRYSQSLGFQTFVNKIISDSVNKGNKPIVMIDSSNCSQLWGWLRDTDINLSDIVLDKKGGTNMQENWQGARIVRIRQELAPGIVEDKVKRLAESFLEDTRTEKELEAAKDKQIKLSVPSGQITGLYKLDVENNTGCVPYLSIGKRSTNQQKRGASCYQEFEQEKDYETEVQKDNDRKSKQKVTNKANFQLQIIETKLPHIKQWSTPNPLEIVVALRQEQDEADNIAGLIEELRYGYGHFKDWTKLPAPLFFERVVRDYISEFTLEEEEETED